MSSNRGAMFYPILGLLLGAGMWGVTWYPMRALESHGLSGVWLVFILYLSAFVVSLPGTAHGVKELRHGWRTLLPLAAAGGWTNIAFVLAILDGNVMRVLLLFYLSPIWAALLGWVFIGERISRWAVVTLVLAMVGALLLLWDSIAGAPWPRGMSDWLALSSGFAFALSNVFVRKDHAVSLAAKSLAVWFGVALLALAIIVCYRMPLPDVSVGVIAGAVALGAGGIMVMTLLVQYGVTHMPVHRSAVILLFELVTGAVSQQLLTDETMTVQAWAGGALIAAAAYLSARASNHP